jgi:two-component system, LytTR family, response regulator
MKVILVDDEPLANLAMQTVLAENCPHVKIAEICTNTDLARSAIIRHRPDVVFLDINMPHESGIDFIANLGDFDFFVVFVSAYDQYAIRAFQLSAVDFILKPITIEAVLEAVQKLTGRVRDKKELERYRVLQDSLKEDISTKMMLPGRTGVYEMVAIADIIYCRAAGHTTEFVLADGRKLVTGSNIGTYKDALLPNGIIQTHQSFLVNIHHVGSFDTNTSELLLKPTPQVKEIARVNVARNFKSSVLDRLRSL